MDLLEWNIMVPNSTKGSIQGLGGQIIYRERAILTLIFSP